jgi:MGT family glycosyltransferase
MLPELTSILEREKPDVVIVDQQALAGALSARRLGLRWATFSTTPAALLDPFEALPKVRAWKAEKLESLQREAGLSPVAEPDLSPELVVIFSVQELVARAASPLDELAGAVPPVDGTRSWPSRFRLVGPAFEDRPETMRFPWERLRERPRMLVSLGTVNASNGEAFYRALVEAVVDLPVEVIIAAPPRCVPDAPDRFVVQDRVPQLALMPHVDLVVCHAGHNTVCEALAHGVPLVLAPIRDDQSMVAEPVVRAGAAVRVRYTRLSSQALRQAITTVLGDHQFRSRAERIGRSLRAAGGANAAASLLEALV